MDENDCNEIYLKIISLENLYFAYKKARKHKTKKEYVIEFEENLQENLIKLHEELEAKTYNPEPLKIFILRDPKTRKISKSAFRDRVVHHALIKVIEPIFDKSFIYDSCANRIGKGNLFALKRFNLFKRKVTCNLRKEAFCFKADIKHYFQEVNHKVLIKIIQRKIKDENANWLIKKILKNGSNKIQQKSFSEKGMPLGNLTSQFFANVYLNELDYFVKHRLKVKHYIRYVDDFVILHKSRQQLKILESKIKEFLIDKLMIELHPDKSRIISLSRGIDFVGFRTFYYHKLLRKRNIRSILNKVKEYKNKEINKDKILESFYGWNAYAKWADSFKLRKEVVKKITLLVPANAAMHFSKSF
ncbi:MAG: reverse transcriptase domain-containing protein [Nanoarchaeota archaeon]|nr:reverse transcriptase domain-containing protein [Nanoarchaeota archaeon]